MPYANRTEVPAEKTRTEIEKLVSKYGVTGFISGWEGARQAISFKLEDRHIRFTLQLPDRTDRRFTRLNGKAAAQKAYDQLVRVAWRELYLLIKAKLVAVESKRITIKDEFVAYTVMPDGRTVSEWLQPQLEDAYMSGKMPPLLPGAET